jgi:hypothetical protein
VTWADSVNTVFWIVSIGALLFSSAGTLDWPSAWIFMAEFVIGGLEFQGARRNKSQRRDGHHNYAIP